MLMSMSPDQEYLRKHQYKDASNFGARAAIHARFGTNPVRFTDWVFDLMHLAPGMRVLELGCGPGLLWIRQLGRMPQNVRVVLSDFSEGMVQQARRLLSRGSAPFNYLVTDAQHIPFGDASFDVVVANHMLYHVPDKLKTLAEIRRVLRPDGQLFASTIGEDHMHEMDELVHRYDPSFPIPRLIRTASFSLENGEEQIKHSFDNVTSHYYENALEVTDASSIVDYILSLAVGRYLEPKGFTRFLQKEIDEHGPIHISSSTGLFVAK